MPSIIGRKNLLGLWASRQHPQQATIIDTHLFFADRGRVAKQLSLLLRDLYHLRIGADYVIDAHDIVTRDAQTAAKQALDIARKALAMIEHLNATKETVAVWGGRAGG